MTRFVDVLVHPPASVLAAEGYRDYLAPEDLPAGPADFAALAAHYRERDAVALVHAFDAGSAVGAAALGNARLAAEVAPYGGVLAGLGCVDPHRGAAAEVDAHDALRMGLRGLFFHPPAQQFDPAARRHAPLWGMVEDLGLPVVVHCGTTVLGSGRPGGAGVVLDVADPLRMDRVAARHPRLSIVLAGVTPPWEEAAVAVALHKANVYLAPAAGMSPAMAAALCGPLAGKAMLGSGFPFGTPEEWRDGWLGPEPAEPGADAVLAGNAARLFGL